MPIRTVIVGPNGGSAGGSGSPTSPAAVFGTGWNETPAGIVNGGNRFFTLKWAPAPSLGLVLVLNGIVQQPGVDFVIGGNVIRYAVAPRTKDWHRAWYAFEYTINGEVPDGDTDGANLTFTLSSQPKPPGSLILALNGVLQEPAAMDYDLAGDAVTYTAAPGVADWHRAWYTTFNAELGYGAVPQGDIDAVNKLFTLDRAPSAGILLVSSGVVQLQGTDFELEGSTVTYTEAPLLWHRAWYQ